MNNKSGCNLGFPTDSNIWYMYFRYRYLRYFGSTWNDDVTKIMD